MSGLRRKQDKIEVGELDISFGTLMEGTSCAESQKRKGGSKGSAERDKIGRHCERGIPEDLHGASAPLGG